MGPPVRTLFFGSGSVALPALRHLLESPLVAIESVVTAPPRPAGRKGNLTPTLVEDAAAAAGLRVRTPATLRDEPVLAELRATTTDLIVLADYGRIIPAAVLALPTHGALNIHPSLLPRHRGAAPVPAAILEGDATTGVTLMRMDEGLDTGPILAQRSMPLSGTEVAPALEEKLAEAGAALLIEHLPSWLDGSLQARPQPEEGATLTRLLKRSDGHLDPARPAMELERQVRAYQPWPGSFLDFEGDRLKVWAAGVLQRLSSIMPGEFALAEGTIVLGTVEGALRLDDIQPAGKRRMTGAEYRRGKHL
jgi:methionyl-tRNA formyltransferase